jgi:hypothetical protein
MNKKLFFAGIFTMVLAAGIVLLGCDNGTGDDGGPSLDGVWSRVNGTAIRFSGNNLQFTTDVTAANVNWPLVGTYTYNSPTLIVTPPPANGEVQNAVQGVAVINGIQLTISGFTGALDYLNNSWTKQ